MLKVWKIWDSVFTYYSSSPTLINKKLRRGGNILTLPFWPNFSFKCFCYLVPKNCFFLNVGSSTKRSFDHSPRCDVLLRDGQCGSHHLPWRSRHLAAQDCKMHWPNGKIRQGIQKSGNPGLHPLSACSGSNFYLRAVPMWSTLSYSQIIRCKSIEGCMLCLLQCKDEFRWSRHFK